MGDLQQARKLSESAIASSHLRCELLRYTDFVVHPVLSTDNTWLMQRRGLLVFLPDYFCGRTQRASVLQMPNGRNKSLKGIEDLW